MSGLVDYGSSDEEDEVEVEQVPEKEVKAAELPSDSQLDHKHSEKDSNTKNNHAPQPEPLEAPTEPQIQPDAPIIGAALRPTAADSTASLPEDTDDTTPRSPYSVSRALLRDLTMPPVPNFDIPPSPPGSPPPTTEKKFAHFLQLKKQGTHFNERLANSSALKNPSLMQKLMDFADVSEEDQYATTLPKDVWDPSGFPKWAYKDELAKSQQQVLKREEEEKLGGPREFVPASGSGESGRSATPCAAPRGAPMSAAERVMAGLDRGKSNSPQVAGTKRKSRFES
ncbi:hypothetical protein VC83_06903 [Pseudogymnoascus destructans]|uniref:HCNGP-like protein n=2 Tax=Pseudogymnoascus destructans TaxID=655981 RepID=L8FW63_PSED2|nr:uncharacterized protein VC83_06903 [Pseudogymnoascus destructans]ELR04708.1 hypothetical protein GMDG_06937 [Pseudogymnoascus destructans 20631-21]OAF56955.2 hypothetical protein VC83_06903 [Pseudogymnoascus destructans]